MRVDDLMLFALVVRLKSFRAAAEQRGVASSVVSKHISRLESDLGTQLLRRSTRKLNLTEAGELLYRHCQMLEQNVALASEELSAYRAEPSGLLRISAPGVSGQLFLPKVIRRYMAMYPGVEVDMVIQDRFDDLIEQGFDLAIRTGTLEDSSLICKRLVTSCWHAFASPAYIERHGAPQTLINCSNMNACCSAISKPAKRTGLVSRLRVKHRSGLMAAFAPTRCWHSAKQRWTVWASRFYRSIWCAMNALPEP